MLFSFLEDDKRQSFRSVNIRGCRKITTSISKLISSSAEILYAHTLKGNIDAVFQ